MEQIKIINLKDDASGPERGSSVLEWTSSFLNKITLSFGNDTLRNFRKIDIKSIIVTDYGNGFVDIAIDVGFFEYISMKEFLEEQGKVYKNTIERDPYFLYTVKFKDMTLQFRERVILKPKDVVKYRTDSRGNYNLKVNESITVVLNQVMETKRMEYEGDVYWSEDKHDRVTYEKEPDEEVSFCVFNFNTYNKGVKKLRQQFMLPIKDLIVTERKIYASLFVKSDTQENLMVIENYFNSTLKNSNIECQIEVLVNDWDKIFITNCLNNDKKSITSFTANDKFYIELENKGDAYVIREEP